MKRFISFVLAIVAGITTWAQRPEDLNFVTDGSSVKWQRVYMAQDSCSVGIFLQNIHARRNCRNVLTEVPGVISFDLAFEPVVVAKDLGYSRNDLPAYITAGKYSAYVTIQLKPDRYRVTVENIWMDLPGFGNTRLEVFAIKRGEFQRKFAPGAAEIIDGYLGLEFDNLDILKLDLDDDW